MKPVKNTIHLIEDDSEDEKAKGMIHSKLKEPIIVNDEEDNEEEDKASNSNIIEMTPQQVLVSHPDSSHIVKNTNEKIDDYNDEEMDDNKSETFNKVMIIQKGQVKGFSRDSD